MKITLEIGGHRRAVDVAVRGELVHVALEDGSPATYRVAHMRDGGVQLRPEREAFPSAQGEASGGHAASEVSPPAAATVGRAHRALLFADGDDRQLWVDGQTVRYHRVEPGREREAIEGTGLSATIPAVVLEVLVKPGDDVVDGQRLVLLESMKMVMPIVAPRAGVVEAVACQPGDSVAPGFALVTLRDVPDEPVAAAVAGPASPVAEENPGSPPAVSP